MLQTKTLLEQLFEQQKAAIDHFFEAIDMGEVETLLELAAECQGTLFLTGIGKSGIIARKIAVTLASTGTRAHYISATDALHGDLGVVSRGDIFLLLSKSGESDELLSLVPCLRNKGASPVCWVSAPQSRLEKACQLAVHLPLVRELCPFNLAPTTSAALQLILGDILAVALMKSKKFSLAEYAKNHPAGRIGKRITLRVKDLMLKCPDLPLCSPQSRLVELLVELSNKRCGCLLVVDEAQKGLGIFTDGDLRRALQTKGAMALQEPICQLMTSPFRSIGPDELAYDAMQTMEADQTHPIMALPVLDGRGKVLGLIKIHDIVQSGL